MLPDECLGNSNISSTLSAECPQHLEEETKIDHNSKEGLDWDVSFQGVVLGAFFYGYCLTQIAGGVVAERFNAKNIFGGTLLVASALAMVFPPAIKTSKELFVVLRALQGFVEGAMTPAFYAVAANWLPEEERGRLLSFILSGKEPFQCQYAKTLFILQAILWE